MTIETLIARYGLIAIGVGAVIEGETVVATGGLLAHRGLLPLGGVIAVAALTSCLADQLLFFLGRHHRDNRLLRRIIAAPAFARALRLIERYPTAFVLLFRFLWGLRTVSPVALGTTSLAWRRFAALNVCAAILWAVIVSLAGYLLSSSLSALGAELRTIEHYALAVIALAALGFGAGWLLRRRLGKP
jgi:membrane protein DedA with SNARE-associated domain